MFKSTHYPIEIIEFNEIDSTNNYCKSLANKTPKKEMVVLAEFQSKGKGQFDNEWESESGKNLTFSILHYPDALEPLQFFHLNRAVSLGILNGILDYVHATLPHRFAQLQENLSIKWPNDIFIGSFKIGGILIENTIQGHHVDHCIIGIGLNINQAQFSPNHPFANSLGNLMETEIDREDLFDLILEQIFKMLHMAPEILKIQYDERLYGYKKTGLFKHNNQILKGRIMGTDEFGKLIIEDQSSPHKSNRTFQHKEVLYTHIFLN